jgi:hypothetical protein
MKARNSGGNPADFRRVGKPLLKRFMVPPRGVHDEGTGSTGPTGPADPGVSPAAAKATTCQLKGFMVPPRGVHGGRTASVSVALAQMEWSTTPSATRSPSPLPRRIRTAPPAAERRPASSRTWWKRYITRSRRQGAFGITSAGSTGQRRDRVIAAAPARTRGKVSQPPGFTIASPSAPIVQAHKAEEAGSKIGDQYY